MLEFSWFDTHLMIKEMAKTYILDTTEITAKILVHVRGIIYFYYTSEQSTCCLHRGIIKQE